MFEDYLRFINAINDNFYWFCALAGSGMFLIQLILNLFGVFDSDDLDANDGGDVRKFKWLSLQAISGFLMMFGWTAITCHKEFEFNSLITNLISLTTGLLVIFTTSSIFKVAKKLQSTGNVFKVDDVIGKEALVYQRIPKEGLGKVSVSVQHFTHEIDAISHNQQEIHSFTRVQIIKKRDDNTVIVTAI